MHTLVAFETKTLIPATKKRLYVLVICPMS